MPKCKVKKDDNKTPNMSTIDGVLTEHNHYGATCPVEGCERVEDKIRYAREIIATYGHLFPERKSKPTA